VPSVLIEVRRSYSPSEGTAILDAVHGALVAAFRIPASDRNLRLVEHRPERFICHSRLTEPEYFTVVTIDCFSGRSLQAKRNLYSEVVERLAQVGIPADHITIVLREIPLENWGIRGGRAACDVDLGFTVEV
jgi:phenylpyruvate tautomerase PptA (4-oxalocrotonate tautomerase family)